MGSISRYGEDDEELFDIDIHGTGERKESTHFQILTTTTTTHQILQQEEDRTFLNNGHHLPLRPSPYYNRHPLTSFPLSAHPEEEEEEEEEEAAAAAEAEEDKDEDREQTQGQIDLARDHAALFESCGLDRPSLSTAPLWDSASSTHSACGDREFSTSRRDSSSSCCSRESSSTNNNNSPACVLVAAAVPEGASASSSKGLVVVAGDGHGRSQLSATNRRLAGSAALSLKLVLGGLCLASKPRCGQEGGNKATTLRGESVCSNKRLNIARDQWSSRIKSGPLLIQQAASRNIAWQRYVEKMREASTRPAGMIGDRHNTNKSVDACRSAPNNRAVKLNEGSGILEAIQHCKQSHSNLLQ